MTPEYKNTLFKELKDYCQNYNIAQFNDELILINCKKHGETKRSYGRYTEKIKANACFFCEDEAERGEVKYFDRANIKVVKDYAVDGISYNYYIPDFSLLVDRKVKNLRNTKNPKGQAVVDFNNESLASFYEMKKGLDHGINSYKFIKNWSELDYIAKASKVTESNNVIVSEEVLETKARVLYSHTCDLGHEWSVTKKNREPKCPYCNNKKVLCGFNDVGCQKPDYLSQWNSDEIDPHTILNRSNTYVQWKCSESHEWSAPVKSRFDGSGCRQCYLENIQKSISNRGERLLKEESPALADEVFDKSILNKLSFNSHQEIQWTCKLNHKYILSPNKRQSGRGCPYCAGSKALAGFNDISAFPEVCEELADSNNSLIPYWSRESIMWRHISEDGKIHEWSATPSARIQDKAGCHVCLNLLIIPGVNDVATTHPKVAAQWAWDNDLQPTEVSWGSSKRINFICKKGHEWTSKVKHAVSGRKQCLDCKPVDNRYRSKGEAALFSFLSTLAPFESNVRRFKKFGVHEIDCFSEDLKLAVEFNGVYWHQTQFKGEGYHERKKEAVEALGYSYIEVWEDIWKDDQEVIESELKDIIGFIDSNPEATIEDVDSLISSKSFLNRTEFLL